MRTWWMSLGVAILGACAAPVGDIGATEAELGLFQVGSGYCFYEGMVDCHDRAGNAFSQPAQALEPVGPDGTCATTLDVSFTTAAGESCSGIIANDDGTNTVSSQNDLAELDLVGQNDDWCYYRGTTTCNIPGTRDTYTYEHGLALPRPAGGCASSQSVDFTRANGHTCQGIIGLFGPRRAIPERVRLGAVPAPDAGGPPSRPIRSVATAEPTKDRR